MQLTAKIKLKPTPEQTDALRRTLLRANEAANYISEKAWETKQFHKFGLQSLVYRDIREKFGLSAQVAVRVIAKVADAYKIDKKVVRVFHPLGAVAFDDRVLSWNMAGSTISIWTVDGRLKGIPFALGEKQAEQLKSRKGETKLSVSNGKFFLLASCDIVEAPPLEVGAGDVLGVDLGVINIAVDSDGTIHSSEKVNEKRRKHRSLRGQLQHTGTRSAKRKLKKLSGKEARFARDVNHTISKQIVKCAKDTKRAIALEDLKGISKRVTVRKAQRSTLHSWSFFQLRSFVEYKALLAGVPVIPVDPRNTSRTCPVCGCIDKKNRKSQSVFRCIKCGHTGLADFIAAGNIRRAAVMQPIVACRGEVHAISSAT